MQKVIDFKFKTLNTIYKNFKEKREKKKEKDVKIKEKNREKQICMYSVLNIHSYF